MAWTTPRDSKPGNLASAWRIHERALDVPASQVSIEAPRLCIQFEYPEINALVGIPGTGCLCGSGHQVTAETAAFQVGKNMDIINQGAPPGVIMAVQKDEPDRLRLDLGDKPEEERSQIA